MIAMLAIDLGIPPQALWDTDPRDLATMIDVLQERARKAKRRGGR